GEEEGFAGINTSNGDIFTMGDITLVDGILRVSGTVEKDYSNNMYRSESGEALLNINVAVDVSAVEDDIIEP
ncbi:MAG: hypothetical protein KAG18_00975, partial [Sinobacterium sp.]|nr:hypothetical protein [Sinobacterium sp.]